jgi:hypothetical protein
MPASNMSVVLVSLAFLLGSLTLGSLAIHAVQRAQQRQHALRHRTVWQPPPDVTTRPGLRVTVGAYSPRRTATPGPPRATAAGAPVPAGMVALSLDVERALGVEIGDRIVLDGLGTFVFHARMASHKRRHVDIGMASTPARRFEAWQTYVVAAQAS